MKEANLKAYLPSHFNSRTLWKRQNYGDSKTISGCQEFEGKKEEIGRAWGIFRAVRLLFDTVMVDTCHYTFVKHIECTTPKVNPSVTHEIWVMMLCQCRFIDCSKCSTLMQDVNHKSNCVCGREVVQNSLYFLLNFAANLKLL